MSLPISRTILTSVEADPKLKVNYVESGSFADFREVQLEAAETADTALKPLTGSVCKDSSVPQCCFEFVNASRVSLTVGSFPR